MHARVRILLHAHLMQQSACARLWAQRLLVRGKRGKVAALLVLPVGEKPCWWEQL
jgi:hypothetical protein